MTSEEHKVQLHKPPKMNLEDIEEENEEEIEEEIEEKTPETNVEPEKEVKRKRKILRCKITRALNRLTDSMKKQEHDRKRYKTELKTISRDFDRVMDINSELYEIMPSHKAKLDKWETEVSNEYYQVVERVNGYSRKSVQTRSKTKKAVIETDSSETESEDSQKNEVDVDKEKLRVKGDAGKKTGGTSDFPSETDSTKEKLKEKRTLQDPEIVDNWIDELVEFEETKFDVSSDSLSLAHVLFRLEATRDIPSFKLSTFNGDPFSYVDFIESFKIHIHEKGSLTDDQRMIQLKAHLAGEAKSTIDALGASGTMYATALKMLKRQFGQRSVIARAFINRLCKGEKLKCSIFPF